MKFLHHRAGLRRAVAALAILVLVAAGCSSGGSDAATDEQGPSTTAASDVDPNGVLRLGYDIRQQTGGGFYFDPVEAKSTVHDGLFYMLYGRFLRPTATGELVPDLAESTTVVDDGTIEIKLRDGLTFSDGTPFDAAAVKAGLERNLELGDPAAFTEAFWDLTSVEVKDPLTVTLKVKDGKAAGWHDSFLGTFQTTITKPGQTDFSQPIGAGPFTVTSYAPDQSVKYAKSPTYWDADSITLGGLEIVQVASDQSASGTNALQAGQIDMVITDATQLAALTGSLDLLAQPDPNQVVALQICKKDGPLSDARVRKAINKAIDREILGEAAYAGTTEPMLEPWPEGHRFYNPAVGEVLAYDPEAAEQLLVEAGYPDGFDVDLYVVAGVGGEEAAQVIDAQLREIGIRSNIKVAGNYVSEFLNPPQPGMGLFPGNAANRAKLNQHSGTALANVCSYADPELDALVAELATVSDSSDEAVELWHEIDKVLVEDALGGFLLFRSKLAGYDTDTVGGASLWPQGTVVLPDPRETWMSAS